MGGGDRRCRLSVPVVTSSVPVVDSDCCNCAIGSGAMRQMLTAGVQYDDDLMMDDDDVMAHALIEGWPIQCLMIPMMTDVTMMTW